MQDSGVSSGRSRSKYVQQSAICSDLLGSLNLCVCTLQDGNWKYTLVTREYTFRREDYSPYQGSFELLIKNEEKVEKKKIGGEIPRDSVRKPRTNDLNM